MRAADFAAMCYRQLRQSFRQAVMIYGMFLRFAGAQYGHVGDQGPGAR